MFAGRHPVCNNTAPTTSRDLLGNLHRPLACQQMTATKDAVLAAAAATPRDDDRITTALQL